ncbi:MAG: hypothetical protein ABIU63_13575 [Chitinophagaceae bacterium]
MSATYYAVKFDFEGKHYDGRLTPTVKKGHEDPASWHVVLNDVFFGHLNKNGQHWEVNEQRPPALTELIGNLIDDKNYQQRAI